MRTRFLKSAALAMVAGLTLAACGQGTTDSAEAPVVTETDVTTVVEEGGNATTGDGPIELTYWAWGVTQPELVDAWNAANPDIQVHHTDAGGNTDTSARLLTATRAGNAPDVALVEYPTLPSMIVGGVARDITEFVDDDVRSRFSPSTWDLTTFDGATYGIPQDVGPMAMIFNQARLSELGVAVPTTWAEFAEAAKAVHAADPETYLTVFAPAEFGFFAGMAQQAGAQWWRIEDGTWHVGIDSPESLAVADYWQDLIDSGAVKVEPLLTPQYNSELNSGHILSWVAGLWAPGVIYGVAPDMAGDWAMARMPQWTPGNDDVAYQGGSAVIVTTSSQHPEAAAKFAEFITSSQEGAQIQLDTGQFPASTAGQQAAAEGSQPPPIMPQQGDFWTLAADIAGHTVPAITWGPNVNVAQSAFEDAMARAIQNGTPLRDALQEVQEAVVSDMRTSGFTVAE